MTTSTLESLLEIMARLRDPEHGCPWDLQQDFHTIVPYTIEEAYELVDAIDAKDFEQIREELGDVLFQVVFYAQLATEQGLFNFQDVVTGIATKLIRRHPHVFAEPGSSPIGHRPTSAQVKDNWEHAKQAEREQKMRNAILDDVPRALPSLSRAQKLQKRAARVGFDWPDADGIWGKIDEEMSELREAIASDSEKEIEAELGDVFIAVVNLARHLGVDAETAVRGANARFERRFRLMEQAARDDGTALQNETIEQLEKRWQIAKARLAAD